MRHVISLADPVGKIIDGGTLDSGLKIERVRTPLGVIGTIYEARPNVTIDVASLCLKPVMQWFYVGEKKHNIPTKF